ncbi:MAG: FG-GAP-like repeat-containing protein [Opitutus sp.]
MNFILNFLFRVLLTMATGVSVLAALPAPELSSIAMRAHNSKPSPTLFAAVKPEVSGLVAENRYDDPSMWKERWLEFSVGAVATGIAVGDFDGDGLPDIYALCRTGPNHLYRNLGNFAFEDVTERAGVGGRSGGPWVNGATFVDINGDARLDLYVCYHAAPNQLFINNGDGTFTERAEQYGLAITTNSVMASFADYDRDGRLDLFLLTNRLDVSHLTGEPDYLYHQNNDGTFTDVSTSAGLSRTDRFQGFAGVWWDPLGTGWPDLYVANDFAGPDRFYRNQHDGTFASVLDASAPSTAYSAMGADAGDINNDGRPDLFVADMRPSDHRRALNSLVVDFDELYRRLEQPVPQLSKNALWLNEGGGHFSEIAFAAGVSATDWSWSPLFGDLDNDGWVDLHVTNGMIRDFMDGDAMLAQSKDVRDQAAFWKKRPTLDEKNRAFRNNRRLGFEDVSAAWGLDLLGTSFGSAMADFDRDGTLDLVISNFNAPLSLYRNTCDTGHAILIQFHSEARGNRLGVGTTVRLRTSQGLLTRTLTLSRGLASGQPHELHFGLGPDAVIAEMEVLWPSGRRQVFHDIPADRIYTVTEPSTSSTAPDTSPPSPAPLFKEVGAAQGLTFVHAGRDVITAELQRQPLLPARMTRLGPGLAWADADGDGVEDVIVTGGIDHAGHFFPSASASTEAQLPFSAAMTREGLGAMVFESNGDGRPDVLVTANAFSEKASEARSISLWLGGTSGEFSDAPAGTLPPFTASPGPVCVADYDQDGDLDLFIGGRYLPGAYPQAVDSALWENRHGQFVDVTATRAPALLACGLVTGAVWSDINGDGRPDLMIVREWGAPLYLENTPEGFIDRSTSGGLKGLTGWWNSITTADLNEDGRMDFVLGNQGLNTPYHATPEKPALLLAGDFGGTGESALIEATFVGEVLHPWRNQIQLARGLRSRAVSLNLLKNFPSFAAYAAAPLEELFSPAKLSTSTIYSANVLESGVLLQNDHGGFDWLPLPMEAQFGPVHGVAIADFDGDGHLDLAMVENSTRAMPHSGRFSGGVGAFLHGSGKGTFTPWHAEESGFLVRGDGRALALGDLNGDGWPDLLAAQTNGPMLAFENRRTQTGGSFSIALRGPAGNPHGTGARVSTIWPDGHRQTAEVTTGEGYLTQSSAKIFIGYPAGQPPASFEVRWPGGRLTRHLWKPGIMLLPFEEAP